MEQKKKELKFQNLQGFRGHYVEFGKEKLYIINLFRRQLMPIKWKCGILGLRW